MAKKGTSIAPPKGKTPIVESRGTTPMARTKPEQIKPKETHTAKPMSKVKPESVKPTESKRDYGK